MGRTRFPLNEEKFERRCSVCGCRIAVHSHYDKCRECMKNELFPKVKEFILNNYDVNELMVSEEFGIDRDIVREWVKEGHLEYKKRPL